MASSSERTPHRNGREHADWKKHGKAAGPIRNTQMAIAAEALIAVTNGSRGTQNMIDTARAYGLKVFVKHEKKRDQA